MRSPRHLVEGRTARFNVLISLPSDEFDLDRQDAEGLLFWTVDAADAGELLLARAVGVDLRRALGVEHLLEGAVAGDALDAREGVVLRPEATRSK